jgi:hypothetical protein
LTSHEEVLLGHTIAREFYISLSSKEEAKKLISTKVKIKKEFKFTPLVFATILSALLCFSSFIFISILSWKYEIEYTDYYDIYMSVFFGLIMIFLFFLMAYLLRDVFVISPNTDMSKVKIKTDDLMNAKLQSLQLEHKKIFPLIEQSFAIALEEGTKENFIALLFATYLSELVLQDIDLLQKEKIKRLFTAISHGNFIIESLDLTGIARDVELQNSLNAVVESFNEIISYEKIMEAPLPFLLMELLEIKKNFELIIPVIDHLKQYESDKTFSKRLKQDADKLRLITETKPIAKTNISFSKESKGLSSDELLSTITAIDEGIIEIRTRAGTYYASISTIQKEDTREHREIELLTDKELEVKIEVLNSTLDFLEREKQNIPVAEYQEIRTKNLTILFAAKKALEKRTGKTKSIICPFCLQKSSTTHESCNNCKQELPYCIVCLSNLGKDDEISICPHCQSLAHAKHFREWIEKSATCPYCRREIKKQLTETILEQISKP